MKLTKYLALAALVAFAACSEGDNGTPPPVTGTISGQVTIEGVGASGITVALSSGTTATTDGSGNYSFSEVDAGAYTVSISGFASDVTFSATAKAATIATAGQVATVNFDGSYVRTSAILGSVAAGGSGLEGVTVSIGSSSTTTDANGQYAFSGLRAGSYTVSISGYDASMYVFSATSYDVTIGVGESKVQNFSGQLQTTASISGYLYLDENPKNNTFESTAEDKLAAADVTISLESGLGTTPTTMQTDATGHYEFSGLAAGTYKVSIDTASAGIPSNVVFGGAALSELVTVTVGSAASVNWAFDIAQQAVTAAAFLGRDGTAPGIAPVEGVTIDLFAKEADAVAGSPVLATGTTDETGTITFRFDRSDDTSPAGNVADNIVFAQRVLPLPANTSLNGETRIEIKYDPRDSLAAAPDTFDLLNTQAVIAVNAMEAGGNTLSNWATALWRNDTTAATEQVVYSNTDGVAFYTVNTPEANMPDTFFVRLSGTQPGANGHGFTYAATANEGTVSNDRYLRVIHNGVTASSDTVEAGDEVVTYTDQDLSFRVHHETDDSTDTPTYTGGDNFTGVENTLIELFKVETDGTLTSVRGPSAPTAGTGWLTWFNVPVGDYVAQARGGVATVAVLNDTTASVTLAGAAQADTVEQLTGNAGMSTFAYKNTNTAISGFIRAWDQVNAMMLPAAGMQVHVQATADNIQPDAGIDTTVVTNSIGDFSVAGLREGPYMVTVMDSVGADGPVWSFLETLETTTTPIGSGTADNTDAYSGTRDTQGAGNVQVAHFRAYRMDTKVSGVVVNDRDADGNVIDPNESLPGAVLQLYQDDVDETGAGNFGRDTLVASDTTDANGAYSFSGLREGRYMVRWVAGTPNTDADVLRSLTSDSVIVTTTAAANVGTTSPATLPRWDYNTSAGVGSLADPAHFMFLYKNTTAEGNVKDGSGGIEGMTISLRRCDDSAGATSPPLAGGTCTTYLGTTVNVTSDANGHFSFPNLIEGVYEIRPQPSTVGGYTNSAPATALYLLVGPGDIETMDFTIS